MLKKRLSQSLGGEPWGVNPALVNLNHQCHSFNLYIESVGMVWWANFENMTSLCRRLNNRVAIRKQFCTDRHALVQCKNSNCESLKLELLSES